MSIQQKAINHEILKLSMREEWLGNLKLRIEQELREAREKRIKKIQLLISTLQIKNKKEGKENDDNYQRSNR